MPLLMIEPASEPPPPEADVSVASGGAATVQVRQGQLLSIETVVPGQVAGLFAWTAADPGEWLSPHHTRVFGGTFVLRLGTRLVTNRRRPIFVVGRDSLRCHDLLLPASEGSVAAVANAISEAGLAIPRIPDPVNLFLWTRLDNDGRIEVRPSPSRAGERWTARVLIDAFVAVAAPSPSPAVDPDDPVVMVRVRNEVTALPVDLPVWAGGEPE
jgi:uncharacterized protein YcgI (DUF1989 family)